MNRRRVLEDVLARLETAYDYAGWHWQPDTPPDYVCISAVLVQHTNWSNVERAIDRLREAGALSLATIARLQDSRLAELVRPAGTPLTKARRLLSLARLAAGHGGIDRLLALPAGDLRARLLATHGIGPETAGAIALYAAGRPHFLIDAYTLRIFRRLGFGPERNGYEVWQRWFEAALPPDVETYRRYHALIVLHGKQTCRPNPRCGACPLLDLCPAGRQNEASEAWQERTQDVTATASAGDT